MISPFAITAATNTIRLDNKRQAETSFTVFNSSGRAMRGRARIVPQDPVAEKWLTVVDDAERDFPIAGTQQYSVHIAPPPDAPAGNYIFRLDVLGVDNPDEELSEGPGVTFEVPPPPPPKKPFPMWIPLVAILVLVLVVVAIVSFFVIKNNQEQEAARNATATAVAQQSANATATAVALPAKFNGTWLKDDGQGDGILTVVISNSGSKIRVGATADYLDRLGITGLSRIPCPGGCTWGTVTTDFVPNDLLNVRLTPIADRRLFHQLLIDINEDGSKLGVADTTMLDGRSTDFNNFTYHK